MRDVEVTCKNCNQIFVIRQSEQEYFSVRKRPLPKYCPICRKVHYAKQAQERKQKENQEWQKKKAEDVKRYYSALKDLEGQFDIIPLEHVVPDPKEKILYIIGNGFDLMHGVRSSYYDFGNTIGKHSHIRFVLENYLESDDLWADFEGALATMNVEAMSQPFVLDTLLDAMDAYDEDAQQVALREIVEADDSLTKYCNKIIDAHKNFFESLSEIDKVITIGHSLYPVDWDYFAEVIRQNKSITPEKQSEREKVIGVSENGRWRVCTCGNIVQLKDDKETVILSRIFSHAMNGAVFVDDQICFWVMRGIDKGVFFLRQIDGEWTYLGELEGIPNQGVITKRLHRILIDEGRAVFVYQSRVRGYSLLDGALVSNMAVRHAPERRYMGRDFTQKFQRIYKGDFY